MGGGDLYGAKVNKAQMSRSNHDTQRKRFRSELLGSAERMGCGPGPMTKRHIRLKIGTGSEEIANGRREKQNPSRI